MWPDEIHRAARADAALAVAECEPPVVRAQPAQDWLPEALPGPPGTAAVVWQSVVWQYVAEQARAAVEAAIRDADGPRAWLRMEPGEDPDAGFLTTVTDWPGGETRELARSLDHGPPVRWLA